MKTNKTSRTGNQYLSHILIFPFITATGVQGAFPIFCKNVISRGGIVTQASSLRVKYHKQGCLWYNVQLVNQKSGMLLFKLCPPLAGVQGVDWISPPIQLLLYYESKFAPLSHAPQTIPPP
ncbi:hypothetical protein KSMBR1_0906 [Candidatus Kuenenia stuttgartiensis]|uniref:Uncharacterized protein n=1 Tax=Kuenenia stuttgartiensis TaxID=174633 RepID=A0A2C9CFA0_KUEST|nr:hypothetical protein KSMBR1_0906 [Candidatus Kuenenia stuttgartiensis]